MIVGTITRVNHVKTKKDGKGMCFGEIKTEKSLLRFVVFPRVYEDARDLLTKGARIEFSGKIEEREGDFQVIFTEAKKHE